MSARYRADSNGTREFMNSKGISDAMRGVASQMAAELSQGAKGTYRVNARTVQGGWDATNRAGAELAETARHWSERTPGAWSDAKLRRLRNVANQFRMRGGG